MKTPIRVLIADDSRTVCDALTALLGEDASIKVVGQASDGAEAVEMARRLSPDVITMDVQMPRLNGLQATAAIMAENPTRILVVCSVTEGHQVDLSFKAVESGALEVIAKPTSGKPEALRTWGRKVADSIKLMAEIPVVTRRRLRPQTRLTPPKSPGSVDLVGLVASTGGPPALAQVLGALPQTLPVPVLIAQHMAPGFMGGLVRWFREASSLRIEVAQDGQAALPGHVYMPPDNLDLVIDEEGILRTPPNRGGHWPSGNRLLHSIASSYGPRGGGVVMTGMGDDGADGLLAIRQAGGIAFAQDEASSVVYGMPQAALRNGAAAEVLSLDIIGPTLREICERRGATRQKA